MRASDFDIRRRDRCGGASSAAGAVSASGANTGAVTASRRVDSSSICSGIAGLTSTGWRRRLGAGQVRRASFAGHYQIGMRAVA